MRISLISLFIFLSGCSSISPYKNSSPVDEALKACGLGYSTEAGGIIEAAYNVTMQTGGINFKTSLKENLNTQVMAFASGMKLNNAVDSDKLIELIKGTQQCVINNIDANRVKTRSELISECSDDLQNRVAGYGKKWPLVKEIFPVVKHPDFSDENLVITVFVDHGGRSAMNSFDALVACKIKENQYYDLELLKTWN